jgi:hypothetical protein
MRGKLGQSRMPDLRGFGLRCQFGDSVRELVDVGLRDRMLLMISFRMEVVLRNTLRRDLVHEEPEGR